MTVKKSVDHLGNEFSSIKAMREFYGVSKRVFDSRIKKGYSLQDVLTKGNLQKKECVDHLGNKFDSITEMCEFYNISRNLFNFRIKSGYSLQEALTKGELCKKECVDHLNNKFKSITAMCKFYNVEVNTFEARIKSGYSLQEALVGKKYIDHLGNEFDSKMAMCDFYNITSDTFNDRIKKGYSLQEALTMSNLSEKESVDHLGNKFSSITAMCNFYRISPYTYSDRIKQNWPQLEALTFPINEEDPFPKEANVGFENIKELCSFLNVSCRAIRRNLSKGRSLNEIIDSKIVFDQKTKDIIYKKGIIYGAFYNNKVVYVGKTSQSLEARKKQHLRDCKKGDNRFYKFLKNFKDQVVFKEIESHSNISCEELNALEVKWIAYYDTFFHGYNSTKGGETGLVSKIFTDEKLQEKILELAKKGKSVNAIAKEISLNNRKMIRNFLFENNLIVKTNKYPSLAKA